MRFVCTAVLPLALMAAASAQERPPAIERAADLARAGEWSQAQAAYETVLAMSPDDAHAWFGIATSLQEQGQHREALDALLEAEGLRFPSRSLLLLRKARAQARLGEGEAALATLDELVQIGFSNAETLRTHPDLAGLRSDAAFDEIIERARRNMRACSATPEFRAFDFWVGEWNVYPAGVGELVGRSRIELILNDCVVLENWTGESGYVGKSYNIFDRATGRWEQFWVDGAGGRIHFTGEAREGNLHYRAETTAPDGSVRHRRLTFFRLGADQVRQLSELSTDGGESWSIEYDFHYHRAHADR